MRLREAIDNGMLGKDMRQRMRGTVPGRLAELIEHALYDCAEDGDRLRFLRRVFVNFGVQVAGGKTFPPFQGLEDGGQYADFAKALTAARDYLEACAVQEVTGR